MVQSRRRRSLLGALALIAGLAALCLTKFNPTGIETVHAGPITLPFGTALAVGASALAMLAFLAAASSTRTGTGLPLLALLVCACTFLLAWKPTFFKRASPPPAAKPLVTAKAPAATPAVPDSGSEHRSKLFDLDSPSVGSTQVQPEAKGPGVRASAAGPPHPAPAARADPAVAVRAARAKMDAAREMVAARLASSPAFQLAKEDADAAEADLRKARIVYESGSPELIAVSRAALAARDKVESLISLAALRDPAYLDAARDLKAAESAK